MKKILILFCLCSLTWSSYGQKTLTEEKTFTVEGKQIALNLKFAKTITVKAWDKPTMMVKTLITLKDETNKKIHKMEVKEESGQILIVSDYALDKKSKGYCWDCEKKKTEWMKCTCFQTAYEIYVPKNASLSLESINGDIEISGLIGVVQAKSINGFVDFSLAKNAKVDLNFKSVNGEIFTDFDIALDKKSTFYSKKINQSLNGGGQALRLETINGDIYFRKNN